MFVILYSLLLYLNMAFVFLPLALVSCLCGRTPEYQLWEENRPPRFWQPLRKNSEDEKGKRFVKYSCVDNSQVNLSGRVTITNVTSFQKCACKIVRLPYIAAVHHRNLFENIDFLRSTPHNYNFLPFSFSPELSEVVVYSGVF